MIELEERVPAIRGSVEIEMMRCGVLVERIIEHNLVVNLGRTRLAQLAAGVSTKAVNQIGVGTGTTPAKLADTKLTNQVLFRVTGASVSGQDAIFTWQLGVNDANGMAITEFGLFTSDNQMLTHFVRGKVIGKDSDLVLNGKYTLHF